MTPKSPSLAMTVTGETLAAVLAAAKERADAYFDGVPYGFARCDATPTVRSHGGDVLLYEAEVLAVAAATSRRAPGAPATMDDPDDTEEVSIP